VTGAGYVHGYSADESVRLGDQADTLAELLHGGTTYPAGSHVLEVGCGVGAQTGHLLASGPGMRLVAFDRSMDSVRQARAAVRDGPAVGWLRADLFGLPFADAVFDHVFVCFVLEHLTRPVEALSRLRRVLRPGGTLTVIEGDHGSAYFHPASTYADDAIACQVRLQAAAGGDALIGRRLYPLVADAGYRDVVVRPRVVYSDRSRPDLVDGFTRRTFTAMIAGVRDEAVDAGLMSAADFDQGVADLRRTAEDDGTFSYTFFKAVAVNP
jgi:SAM-dependent methyltransferase